MEYRVRYHITCVRAQRALASPLNTLTTREARAPISHAATRTRGTAARPDPRGAGGVTGHTARLLSIAVHPPLVYSSMVTLDSQNYIHERRGGSRTSVGHAIRWTQTHETRDTKHSWHRWRCHAMHRGLHCTTAALCTCGTAHGPHKRHSMTRLYDVFAVTTVTVTDLTNKRTWIGRAVRRFLFMPCRAQCCQIAPSFRNAACTHGRA